MKQHLFFFLILPFILSCSKNKDSNKNESSIFIITDRVYGLTENSNIINHQDTIGFIKKINILPSNDILLELQFDSLIPPPYSPFDLRTEDIIFGEKCLELILKLKRSKDNFHEINWGDTLKSNIKLEENQSITVKDLPFEVDSLAFKIKDILDSLPQILKNNTSNYLNSSN